MNAAQWLFQNWSDIGPWLAEVDPLPFAEWNHPQTIKRHYDEAHAVTHRPNRAVSLVPEPRPPAAPRARVTVKSLPASTAEDDDDDEPEEAVDQAEYETDDDDLAPEDSDGPDELRSKLVAALRRIGEFRERTEVLQKRLNELDKLIDRRNVELAELELRLADRPGPLLSGQETVPENLADWVPPKASRGN